MSKNFAEVMWRGVPNGYWDNVYLLGAPPLRELRPRRWRSSWLPVISETCEQSGFNERTQQLEMVFLIIRDAVVGRLEHRVDGPLFDVYSEFDPERWRVHAGDRMMLPLGLSAS